MTITIDLSRQDEGRLNAAARRRGIGPEELAVKILTDNLPPITAPEPDAENQALIELIRSWRAEDATADETELSRRDDTVREVMGNIRANRLSLPDQGAR